MLFCISKRLLTYLIIYNNINCWIAVFIKLYKPSLLCLKEILSKVIKNKEDR